jgi:hypothetical protein
MIWMQKSNSGNALKKCFQSKNKKPTVSEAVGFLVDYTSNKVAS